MPITEQTKDRLAALEQLATSLAAVCRAAISGADNDDPRVDPLMGTVRKIYFATANLGSQVSRISSVSTVERLLADDLFEAISIDLPSDLAGTQISLRQFQNAVNEVSPTTSFADITAAFGSETDAA